MASKLYPPQVEGILPAFYKTYNDDGEVTGASLKIPFGLNRAVAIKEILGLQVRIKTVSTNTQVYIGFNSTWDQTELVAYFDIDADTAENINEGQFYKAQLAFVNQEEVVGYWSTVGTIKCVTKPKVSIANFKSTEVNGFIQEFVGVYEQDTTYGDSTEKVETYEFNIYDISNQLILSSGLQLHNSADDISSSSSQDVFKTNHLVEEGKMYYIEYIVTTLNNLTISSPLYKIMQTESVDIEYPLELHCNNNFENGYIELFLRGIMNVETGMEQIYTGTFLITRGSDKDNYFEWDEIIRFNMDSGYPSDYIFRDFTVEQGITYKYRIQQFNVHQLYSNPIYLTDINTRKEIAVVADFEDMFISDGKRRLRVRYNPKVTSFKNNIPEQKIETIGSKYPFIFRNGHVNYKEFPISGLISYSMDDAMLFLNTDELEEAKILEPMYVRTGSGHVSIVSGGSTPHNVTHEVIQKITSDGAAPVIYNVQKEWVAGTERVYDDTNIIGESIGIKNRVIRQNKDLTTENLMGERYFKLKVLDWLTDGEVKLFRSPGEGNYLVRILNVSMTPNDTVGRMLHTFTGTCYEIDDLTYDNLIQYGIVTENVVTLTEMHWGSSNINKIIANYNGITEISPDSDTLGPWNKRYALDENGKRYKTEGVWVKQKSNNWDGFYVIPLNSDTVLGFICSDFAPGDIIEVVFAGVYDTEYIVIGNTGSYNYDFDDRIIISLAIKPSDNYDNITDFSRIISYKYEGLQKRKFDTISNISTQTQIATQYIGPYENVLEPFVLRTSDATPLDDADSPRFVQTLTDIHRHPNIRLSDTVVKFDVLQVEILHAQRRMLIPVYSLGSVTMDNNGIVQEPMIQVYMRADSFNPDTQYYILENEEYILVENLNEFEEDTEYYYLKDQTAGYVLTPFGTGYVNYNTVYKDIGQHIDTVDGNVLQKIIEDSKIYVNKYDIEDINFTLEDDIATPIDAYSILQVFNPIVENDNFIGWEPTNIYYDTYIHDWIFSYDPYFSINDDDNNEFLGEPNKIYLDDIEEITYTNLGDIDKLEIGNGAMVEITFQLQIVDYSLEEDNEVVKNYREIYYDNKYGPKGYFTNMINYFEKKESSAYQNLENSLFEIEEEIKATAKNSAPNILKDGELDISYNQYGTPILDETDSEYAKIIAEVQKVMNDVAEAEPLKAQMLVLQQEIFNDLLYGWNDENINEYVIATVYSDKIQYYSLNEDNEYVKVNDITTTDFDNNTYYIYTPKHYTGLLEEKAAPVYFGTNTPIPVDNKWYSYPMSVNEVDQYTVGHLVTSKYGTDWWPARWWPMNYQSAENYRDAYYYSVQLEFNEKDNPSSGVTTDTAALLKQDTTMDIIMNDQRYWDTANAIVYRIGDQYRTTDTERELLIPEFSDIIDENSIELGKLENGDEIVGNWYWVDDSIKYIPVEEELEIPVYYDNAQGNKQLVTEFTDIGDSDLYYKQSDYRIYKQQLNNFNSLQYYIENNKYNSNIIKNLLSNENFVNNNMREILNYLQNININLLYVLLHSPILDDDNNNVIINALNIEQNKPEIDFKPTSGETRELLDKLTIQNKYGVNIENAALSKLFVIRHELASFISDDISNYIYYIFENNMYKEVEITKKTNNNITTYYCRDNQIFSDDKGFYFNIAAENADTIKQYLYIETIWYQNIESEKDDNGDYEDIQFIYNPYLLKTGEIDPITNKLKEDGILHIDDIDTNGNKKYQPYIDLCIDYFKNVKELSFLYSNFWIGKVGSFVEVKDDLLVAFNNLLEVLIPYKLYKVNEQIIFNHLNHIYYNGQTITAYLDGLEKAIKTFGEQQAAWQTVKEQTAILLQDTPDDQELKDLYATADYSIKSYELRKVSTQVELDEFYQTELYQKYRIVETRYKEIERICNDYDEKYNHTKTTFDNIFIIYEILRNFIYDLLLYSYYNKAKDDPYQLEYDKIKIAINTYLAHNSSISTEVDELLSFYLLSNKAIQIQLGYFTINALLDEISDEATIEDLEAYDNKLIEYQNIEKLLCEHYLALIEQVQDLYRIYQGRSSFVKNLSDIITKYTDLIATDKNKLIDYIDQMKKIIKKLEELDASAPTDEDIYQLKILLTRYLLSLQEYYIIDVEGRYDT